MSKIRRNGLMMRNWKSRTSKWTKTSYYSTKSTYLRKSCESRRKIRNRWSMKNFTNTIKMLRSRSDQPTYSHSPTVC